MTNFLMKLLLLACFFLVPSRLQAQEIHQGVGIICDTQLQAESYVRDWNGSNDETLKLVNNGSTACAIVGVVYLKGQKVSEARGKGGSFEVTPIMVVGVISPLGIQRVQPFPQFTLFKSQGTEI
jgi:hypothetical protein